MTFSKRIVWLDQADGEVAMMGPKAATLARLCRAGLPLPDGFCITVDDWGGVSSGTHQVLDNHRDVDESPFSFSLPSDLRHEILEAYRALCARSGEEIEVAVRSSALSEDWASASFAGQYESHLNIQGEEALLAAVSRCWASAWSARVPIYKEQHNINQRQVGMAVIVQRMIPAEIAGVLFTIDPVTGNPRHIVIEAVPGVSADFVAGAVTPARYVVDRYDNRVVKSDHTAIIPASFSRSNAWTPLVELALQVERGCQGPQDIEWAFWDGQFWILQSRPVTAQPVRPDPSNLTRANIGEAMPGIVTPLTWSTFLRALQLGERDDQQVRPSEMAVLIDGRAYMDVQGFWNSYSNIPGVNPATVLSKGLGCDLEGRESELASASAPVGVVDTLKKTVYVWLEMLTGYVERPRLRRRLRHRLGPELDEMAKAKLDIMGNREIWRDIQCLLQLTSQAFLLHMQASFIALCAYASVRDSLVEIAGAEVADSLMSMTAHPPANALALRRELETLGSEVRASPEIARLFFDSSADPLFQALSSSPDGQLFLDKLVQRARLLGDRAMQEFELSAPRWSEDPRPLLVALQALVVGGPRGQGSLADQVGPDHQIDLTTLLSHVSPLRRWLLRRVHHAFVTYIRLREETKAVLATCFVEMRRRYLILGARLHTDGLLAQEEDIFFLSLDEVQEVLADRPTGKNYRDSIRRRRTIYADYEAHGSSPTSEVVAEGSSTLSGTPVSGGRVTGRARIVLYPSLSSLQQGEIIVTESTDPGWMPLFLVAGAIVTEIGGMLSHTATLARELNKPAVFSVVGATRLIRDGQLITVDGGQGQVYIHTEEAVL